MYTVEKKANDLNYIITTPDRRKQKQLCHINILKEYVDRDSSKVNQITQFAQSLKNKYVDRDSSNVNQLTQFAQSLKNKVI